MTNKLLNYNFILGRNILNKLGIIFNFKNQTITWQEVLISVKPPNCTAKQFFEIKEIIPVRNATKTIKQILYAKYKKIKMNPLVMTLKYAKDALF